MNVKLCTWQWEMIVVVGVLGAVGVVVHSPPIEMVGATAVVLSFAHGQVSDRMAEREAARERPNVECHAMARRYFVGKEALWFIYFAVKGSWSALVGVVVFLAYPIWRAWWRAHSPLSTGEESK